MPDITITVSDATVARLAALADPSWESAASADAAAAVIYQLIDHAQQAVYRPGSWEHAWIKQAFGDSWLERMEPDDRPEMLSADGRIIFLRPRRLWDSG